MLKNYFSLIKIPLVFCQRKFLIVKKLRKIKNSCSFSLLSAYILSFDEKGTLKMVTYCCCYLSKVNCNYCLLKGKLFVKSSLLLFVKHQPLMLSKNNYCFCLIFVIVDRTHYFSWWWDTLMLSFTLKIYEGIGFLVFSLLGDMMGMTDVSALAWEKVLEYLKLKF